MLYFSSEVKMEGPNEKWGPKGKVKGKKNFAPELGPLTFNLLPTPMQCMCNYALSVHFWCLYILSL